MAIVFIIQQHLLPLHQLFQVKRLAGCLAQQEWPRGNWPRTKSSSSSLFLDAGHCSTQACVTKSFASIALHFCLFTSSREEDFVCNAYYNFNTTISIGGPSLYLHCYLAWRTSHRGHFGDGMWINSPPTLPHSPYCAPFPQCLHR